MDNVYCVKFCVTAAQTWFMNIYMQQFNVTNSKNIPTNTLSICNGHHTNISTNTNTNTNTSTDTDTEIETNANVNINIATDTNVTNRSNTNSLSPKTKLLRDTLEKLELIDDKDDTDNNDNNGNNGKGNNKKRPHVSPSGRTVSEAKRMHLDDNVVNVDVDVDVSTLFGISGKNWQSSSCVKVSLYCKSICLCGDIFLVL